MKVFFEFVRQALVLAGYAAHQGYVGWWAAAGLSALVNFMLDQSWFLLGRWRGEKLLARFGALRRGVEAMRPRLERHRRWIVFGVRFMYGLRTAGPIALGMARVPWVEFVLFNALGAVVWAVVFAGLGFAFGRTIAVVIGKVAHYETVVIAVILGAGLCVWIWRLCRRSA